MNTVKYKEGVTLQNMFLKNMGIKDTKEINDWWIKGRDNKYKIKGLAEAKELILQFKDKEITICGDYDTDGITSVGILFLILKWIGVKTVSFLVPARFSEGFGINKRMIDDIKPGTLIITCDNGIAQLDAIKYAKEKGFTVIVIDHHEPVVDEESNVHLPEADIIIDPMAIEDSADFTGYCGAGLCYKLGCEFFPQGDIRREILCSLAAVGTIGDCMTLHEDNYYIVRHGIKLLLKDETTTKGMRAILKLMEKEHLNSTDIAFNICPVINSVSRLNDEGAAIAIQCLLSYKSSDAEAIKNATYLIEWNKKRKELKDAGKEKARELIRIQKKDESCPIVLYIPETEEGILGLIASDIVERYNKPTIVFSDAKEPGHIKASARSCGNYHMKKKLDEASYSFKQLTGKELFIAYGGHEGAAGMTIKKEDLKMFEKILSSNAKDFVYEDETVYIDIKTADINTAANEMQQFEPYGQGNPQPLFIVKDFAPEMDKDGKKKTLYKGGTVKFASKGISALCFGMSGDLKDIDNSVSTLTFVGTIGDNWYKGRCSRQILVNEVIDRDNA